MVWRVLAWNPGNKRIRVEWLAFVVIDCAALVAQQLSRDLAISKSLV